MSESMHMEQSVDTKDKNFSANENRSVDGPRKNQLVALSDGIDRLTQILYVVSTILFAGTMFTGIFFRYVLNNSLSWADELACSFFIWATFFSISGAYLHDQHIKLDLIPEFCT